VEALLELAAEDQRLRATLPLGLDLADADALGPQLSETVDALRDWLSRADPAAVAGKLRGRAWPATRPAPIRPLAQAEAIESSTLDTVVTVRRGLRWSLSAGPDGARVTLRTFDRELSFPAFCEAPLRALLSGAVTRVGDLPDLDDDDRLVLIRRLLREAIIVPADPTGSDPTKEDR
jgi:hypothetical protein